jgi:hypothetical protein
MFFCLYLQNAHKLEVYSMASSTELRPKKIIHDNNHYCVIKHNLKKIEQNDYHDPGSETSECVHARAMGLGEAPPNKLLPQLKKQVPSVKEAGELAPPNPPMPFCSAGELLCSATDRPWTCAAASFRNGALCSAAAAAPPWAF